MANQTCTVLLAPIRRPDGSYPKTLISCVAASQEAARSEVERINGHLADAGRPQVAYYRLGGAERWLDRGCIWAY